MSDAIFQSGRFSLGRVRAASPWRATAAFAARDREITAEALRREAEDHGADEVVEIDFEIEECRGECAGVLLRRLVATGHAVRAALST